MHYLDYSPKQKLMGECRRYTPIINANLEAQMESKPEAEPKQENERYPENMKFNRSKNFSFNSDHFYSVINTPDHPTPAGLMIDKKLDSLAEKVIESYYGCSNDTEHIRRCIESENQIRKTDEKFSSSPLSSSSSSPSSLLSSSYYTCSQFHPKEYMLFLEKSGVLLRTKSSNTQITRRLDLISIIARITERNDLKIITLIQAIAYFDKYVYYTEGFDLNSDDAVTFVITALILSSKKNDDPELDYPLIAEYNKNPEKNKLNENKMLAILGYQLEPPNVLWFLNHIAWSYSDEDLFKAISLAKNDYLDEDYENNLEKSGKINRDRCRFSDFNGDECRQKMCRLLVSISLFYIIKDNEFLPSVIATSVFFICSFMCYLQFLNPFEISFTAIIECSLGIIEAFLTHSGSVQIFIPQEDIFKLTDCIVHINTLIKKIKKFLSSKIQKKITIGSPNVTHINKKRKIFDEKNDSVFGCNLVNTNEDNYNFRNDNQNIHSDNHYDINTFIDPHAIFKTEFYTSTRTELFIPPVPVAQISSFSKVSYLGGGSFGQVYRCVDKSNTCYALKYFTAQDDNLGLEGSFLSELSVLLSLNHPNIVKIKYIIEDNPVFALELMDTNLKDYIFKYPVHKHNQNFQEYVTNQIVDGLHYIHSRGFVVRDLKPENVLVSGRFSESNYNHYKYIYLLNSNLKIKLADFGSCISSYDNEPQSSHVVTLSYRAPELVLGATSYGQEVDIWALGCTLYYVCRNSYLFNDEYLCDFSDSYNEIVYHPILEKQLDLVGPIDTSIWPGAKKLKFFDESLTEKRTNKVIPLDRCLLGLNNKVVQIIKLCLNLTPQKRPPTFIIKQILCDYPYNKQTNKEEIYKGDGDHKNEKCLNKKNNKHKNMSVKLGK